MNYLNSFLLVVFISVIGVFSDEINMLEELMKECNFSTVYNTSQIDTLINESEFKECKNWSAISSINSSEQFGDDNINNIRCLLYYESLIPICKNESNSEKIYDILIATPKYTNIENFCETILKSESQRVQNVITTNMSCQHLCMGYQKGKPVLNMMCIKSYSFIKFLHEIKQSQISTLQNINKPKVDDVVSAKERSEIPSVVSSSPIESEQKPSDNVPAQKEHNQDVSTREEEKKPNYNATRNDESKTELLDSIHSEPKKVDQTILTKETDQQVPQVNPSSQKSEIAKAVPPQENGKNEDTPPADLGEGPNNVFNAGVDDMAPPGNKDLTNLNSKSSTVANDRLSKVQNGQEVKPKDDLNTDNDVDNEQPPKLDDQNHAPGDDYDLEPEKTEQFNEPKKDDLLGDADPEDAAPDTDKMPKVSQLSDRYSYDADIDGNSSFFAYFSFTCVIFVIGYVIYHNKTKVLALVVEGRHSRRNQRVRRPNIANYQKLDCNLEEAISSSVSKNSSHVIY